MSNFDPKLRVPASEISIFRLYSYMAKGIQAVPDVKLSIILDASDSTINFSWMKHISGYGSAYRQLYLPTQEFDQMPEFAVKEYLNDGAEKFLRRLREEEAKAVRAKEEQEAKKKENEAKAKLAETSAQAERLLSTVTGSTKLLGGKTDDQE